MKLATWKLTLIAYVLLLSPVVFAQEREAEPGEKVVLLKLGRSGQRQSTAEVTKIALATAPARRPETEGLVEARARVRGNDLIIEFADPLPNKSQIITIGSKLPLDDIGEVFCVVEAGRYKIDYSQEGVASVRLPLTVNALLMESAHRRRKSKFWGGIG